MIPFNRPLKVGGEVDFIQKAIANNKLAGGGEFTEKCQSWFENKLLCNKALLTSSCTHSLEMASILLGVVDGDEIIMPSYTFVSTANAFVRSGAKVVFVDVHKNTMNIDERLIEAAITPRTKAIVVVHYAGVSCKMEAILGIAKKNKLFVIEDAAQAMMASYGNTPLGTIGDIGVYSFHDTKNYISGGEGGLLIINNEKLVERSEIIREKGTNRSQYLRGGVDKYTWVDVGSSYLMSEIQAAYLWPALLKSDVVNQYRLRLWEMYHDLFSALDDKGFVDRPSVPAGCIHNAHMFYLKVNDKDVRQELISYLRKKHVSAAFHYVPLHSSPAGENFGVFVGNDVHTTAESDKIIRLPLFYGLTEEEVVCIVEKVYNFYHLSVSIN